MCAAGAAAGLALACNVLGGRPTPNPEDQAALSAFEGGVGDIEEAFQALGARLRDDPAGMRTAAVDALGSPDSAVRIASLYVLAETAAADGALPELARRLDNDDATERLLAAAGLTLAGDRRGLPVLIAALSDDTPMSYAEPPQAAWEYARLLLIQYTEGDFGLLAAGNRNSAAAAQPAWQAWWDENGGQLRWDASLERFQ